ncbi:MAG: hypothetical protein QOK18_4901 [Mycobacterium sp.]|jgi:DNA-binding CsgD family transcriptional regulator|nr:hypothetical protein [Mycobacterium sp.]MDT7757654.1 hypothetical protein [Mycobacterium sp.]
MLDRPEAVRAVDRLLDVAARVPAALLVEGEPGIGKTTLCLRAVEMARARGVRVLTTRPAQAESVVAYTALADLLGGVESEVLAALPEPQLRAVDQVLLRAGADGPATEPRAVAAAFLSIIETLAERTPVVVAIDDAQWLDPSSVFVLDFAARRFAGRIGVLATFRTERGSGDTTSWLNVHDPEAQRRITLPPFTVGEVAELLHSSLRVRFDRHEINRIHQISGGNPFYAQELGRSVTEGQAEGDLALPHTLSDLVQARIGVLDSGTLTALLAVACLAAPTVGLVASAIDSSTDETVELLERVEDDDIVRIDGNSIRYSHPILARWVYGNAPAGARRVMHRRLADLVDQPELRARHLALGATSADETTLHALDSAAAMARSRGAPAAAAELLDLAVNLGGDDPELEIRSAAHHFESGNSGRARALLDAALKRLKAGQLRARAASLLATIVMYADGFGSSASLLERYLPDASGDVALTIHMSMALSYALMNTGAKAQSMQYVDRAVVHAEGIGQPALLSQALGLRVVLNFMCGGGVDHANLSRALALHDDRAPAPVAFQPKLQRALLMAWTGELAAAQEQLGAIQRRRIDNGEDSEWIFISYHRAMVEMWLGDFPAADRIADQMMERAAHLDGDVSLFSALSVRSALAAYAGRVDEARHAARIALDASKRSEGRELNGWMVANIGFLEVSLGNYEAALTELRPVIDGLLADPDYSEIIVASGVSDAVEAMVRLGRLDEAEGLTALIERNGSRLDRPWMLSVAGRCRSTLLAARGDVAGAVRTAEAAIAVHDRIPMPFERARTQLLLGQLQRRQRRKQAASATLREALEAFERLNTPLWAERARADLARLTVNDGVAELSPSERRVAELAASGMTNRAIAAEMFISPKTVDLNLTRVYRKLGIHSRAQLGRWVSDNPS